jgi:hypothetical protein
MILRDSQLLREILEAEIHSQLRCVLQKELSRGLIVIRNRHFDQIRHHAPGVRLNAKAERTRPASAASGSEDLSQGDY